MSEKEKTIWDYTPEELDEMTDEERNNLPVWDLFWMRHRWTRSRYIESKIKEDASFIVNNLNFQKEEEVKSAIERVKMNVSLFFKRF